MEYDERLEKEWSERDWSTLIYTIQRKNCILMLGPDVAVEGKEGQRKSLTEIMAENLAKNISVSKIVSSNLAQVAQHYSLELGRHDLEAEVNSFYNTRQDQTCELHRNLATLPFYLIVTSTPDDMIYKALKENKELNKEPIRARYNFRGENPDIVQMGTVEKPLIFYLLGTTEEPESLVLTENDLLDFLMAVILKNPAIPNNILSDLREKNKSLLFLGFGFNNWYLRILLRVLQLHNKESRSFALEQFNPSDMDGFQRTILFYKSGYKIQIYNKELDSFVRELRDRFETDKKVSPKKDSSAEIIPEGAPTVFICHASEDKEKAALLYEKLKNAGLRPWLDKKDLRGGDRWDDHIEKTIKKIDYFVVLQSKVMAEKIEGYVNKEIDLAAERQSYFRSPIRFIIPVRIEDAPLLEDLDYLQTIDLSDTEKIADLISVIKRDQQRRKKN